MSKYTTTLFLDQVPRVTRRKLAAMLPAGHPGLSQQGFAKFFQRRLCGWQATLDHRAESGHLTVRPGVVAIALDGSGKAYEAVGGGEYEGAREWAEIPSA